MTARLPEEIERELWEHESEMGTLRDAVASLPGLETYRRSNGRTFYASRLTDSEDDAREILQRRRDLQSEIREHEKAIRSLRGEYRAMTTPWPVGCEDLATLLAVQLSTVHQWRKRGILPEPSGLIGGAPWWWRVDILEWARTTKRIDRVLAALAA